MDKDTQSVSTSQIWAGLIVAILMVTMMSATALTLKKVAKVEKTIDEIVGDVDVLRSYIWAVDDTDIRGDELELSEHPVDVSSLIYWDHDRDNNTPPQLEKIYSINPSAVSEIASKLNYPLEYYVVSDLGSILPNRMLILEKYR